MRLVWMNVYASSERTKFLADHSRLLCEHQITTQYDPDGVVSRCSCMCLRSNVLHHQPIVRCERDSVDHQECAYAVVLVQESIAMRLDRPGKLQEEIWSHGLRAREL